MTPSPAQPPSQELSSLVELTTQLVRIPSPLGSPGARKVLQECNTWFGERGLESRILRRAGSPIALVASIDSGRPGPTLCLNACADTAPIGDRAAWTVPPFSAAIVDGWLYGRGSADSKAGIAVFCHVLEHWAHVGLPAGRLLACFDADEHSGLFRGIQTFLERFPETTAAMIGYPGQDAVRTGARGYWRGAITVYGVGQHSGSRRPPRNAIVKATELVRALSKLGAPENDDGVRPQVTVTGIRGGAGYTMVPDRCVVSVDMRLTPEFDSQWAEKVVHRTMLAVDDRFPYERPSTLRRRYGWPAYSLSYNEPVVAALSESAREVLGRAVPHQVAGPSNVGNLFATRGVPATCGFGVLHQSIHAPDEAFEIASLESTLATYVRAAARYLTHDGAHSDGEGGARSRDGSP